MRYLLLIILAVLTGCGMGQPAGVDLHDLCQSSQGAGGDINTTTVSVSCNNPPAPVIVTSERRR